MLTPLAWATRLLVPRCLAVPQFLQERGSTPMAFFLGDFSDRTQVWWSRPWFFLDWSTSRDGDSGKRGLLFYILGRLALITYYQSVSPTREIQAPAPPTASFPWSPRTRFEAKFFDRERGGAQPWADRLPHTHVSKLTVAGSAVTSFYFLTWSWLENRQGGMPMSWLLFIALVCREGRIGTRR